MMNAKELDGNKFPTISLRMHENIYYKNLQQQVKEEVKEREEDEANSLFKLTESLLPKQEFSLQKKVDVKFFSDTEKFSMIMRAVSEQSGISIDHIKGHRHLREIVAPRSIVIFLTRYVTEWSLNEIGRVVVNGVKLDHCTIFHACTRIKEAIDTREPKTYQLILKAVSQLNNEGLYINFKFNHPKWYVRLLAKYEKAEPQTLVTG